MILVTGGAGFIGSNFVRLLCHNGYDVVVVDNLTYAADYNYIKDLSTVLFVKCDISDKKAITEVFDKYQIDVVFNFAAESHVDNSIADCMPFIHTNIIGTVNLLELSVKDNLRYIQISTDEVFGSIDKGWFNETSQIQPRNPYSASKASAEHFVNAYHNTYGLRSTIVNCSNNYGPHQHEEKLIPMTIKKILKGEKIPVYGDGLQIRDWVFVEDACEAIFKVYRKGAIGERYCVGGNNEYTNINIIKTLIDIMGSSVDNIQFVNDRPGHDKRYATDIKKINDLGWAPTTNLKDGLIKTIQWIKEYENRV